VVAIVRAGCSSRSAAAAAQRRSVSETIPRARRRVALPVRER
jgi:hypothetical protein